MAAALYVTLGVATLLGTMGNFLPIDPIKGLYWSAVINGVTAAPIMAIMMRLADNPSVTGRLILSPRLRIVGWVATVIMALRVVGMIVTMAA